jgi:segregation and condensation protein B
MPPMSKLIENEAEAAESANPRDESADNAGRPVDEAATEHSDAANGADAAEGEDDGDGADAAEGVDGGDDVVATEAAGPAAEAADSASEGSESPTDAAPVEVDTASIVEAVLFATDAPLAAKKIAQIIGVGNAGDVKKHIAALNAEYEATGRSFRIEEIAKGFQMLTLPVYNNWLKQVLRIRDETKLSGAALETLAIVAYKQPLVRAEVEAIRGVACGEMINRLREMNLVKIVGRAEELGRPMLYGTTRHFLEVFGLGSLADLPKSEELAPPAAE